MSGLTQNIKQWIFTGELYNVADEYLTQWNLGDARQLSLLDKFELLSGYIKLSDVEREYLTQIVQHCFFESIMWEDEMGELYEDIQLNLSGLDNPNHLDTFEFFWRLWSMNESTFFEPYCDLLYGNQLSEENLIEYSKKI